LNMNNLVRTFSGREITSEDINQIKWARKTYPNLSRTELAGTICHIIDWTTNSGRAKLIQCRALLEEMEKEGIIDLPPLQTEMRKKIIAKVPILNLKPEKDIKGTVKAFEPVKLIVANPGEELKRWRSYIKQYHILGDKWVFGCRLQYFIKSGDVELGCMQFSASAWSLEKRDKWIRWTKDDRKARLHLIVNNSRFLIFPWVHIKNLASKSLSLAVKQIQQDWLREYCYAPVLLETFVDTEKYQGISYKAANWIYLGNTKGAGRTGRKDDLSRKAIFVYPLQDDFKACLRGEKPYKVVEPL
jgi:hypothetical protein